MSQLGPQTEIIRSRSGLSIRYKFLLVTTLLLIMSVGSYLLLAAEVFKRDKTELVFDLTRSLASNTAGEIETLFSGIQDRIKVVSLVAGESGARGKSIIDGIFENESDIVFLAKSAKFRALDEVLFSDTTYSETYGIDRSYFLDRLAKERPVPFEEIQTTGEAVWNATLKSGPPLLGYGKNVLVESGLGQGSPFAVIVYVRADRLLKSLAANGTSEVFLTNRAGEVLLHSDAAKLSGSLQAEAHPLFKIAGNSPVKTGVAEFTMNGSKWLGAYSRTLHNRAIVFSEADGAKIFSVVYRLLRQSLLFGLVVITLAFIAAILFSQSLTRNIRSLAIAMGRVSEGDLNTAIKVQSRDEIGILAQSFNKMTSDLKESREKIEEINRDLENKVRDRTKRLAEQNQTIQKTQEALLQSSRLAAAGEIAGRAAHEVLNPLTSILARIEKIRRRLMSSGHEDTEFIKQISESWKTDVREGGFEKLVAEWKAPSRVNEGQTLWEEDLENIEDTANRLNEQNSTTIADTDFLIQEGQRINKIVQSMRTLSDSRREIALISGRSVLRQAVQIMADYSDQSAIHIEEDCDVESDLIEVDRDELVQSLTNLLRNSIQAVRARLSQSDEGVKGTITLRMRESDGALTIDVIDNGVGIDPVDQVKLFETQFSTKTKEEGTGLGLSISRRFLRASGGDIKFVHSRPNEETIFRIFIPLKERDADVKDQAV